MEKNRNYFIAIALSVVIVLAWQFLYMNPRIEQQRRAEEARRAAADDAATTGTGCRTRRDRRRRTACLLHAGRRHGDA